VLPDRVFTRAGKVEYAPLMRQIVAQEEMEPTNPMYEQDEELLKPWIDTHQLKKVNKVWYKDGRRMVTDRMEGKRLLIQAHHDTPEYGHPRINKTHQLTS